MKKIYLTLFVIVASLGFGFGQACVVDATNTTFMAPAADQFPCITQGVATNSTHVIQIAIPTQYAAGPLTVTVDSFYITSITGLPLGLTYACNPASCSFPGGTNACIAIMGTTTDTAKSYTLTFLGKACGATFGQHACLDFAQVPANYRPSYSVEVRAQGGACTHLVSGINTFNSELNSVMNVFPNPSTGTFELKLNAGSRVNGEIAVIDVTGKKVFAQPLDVVGMYSTTIDLSAYSKGLYTVQLRTAEGFASKNISIE